MTQEQKKKEYRTDSSAPSELFEEAISGMGFGSDEMICDWCQREHLCPDNEYADRHIEDRQAFLKDCMERKSENPDGIVLHYGIDSVSGTSFNGMTFVIGCPCNGLGRYEKFIWAERNKIRTFLKMKVDQELTFMQQEKVLNTLAGIDNKSEETEKVWWGIR